MTTKEAIETGKNRLRAYNSRDDGEVMYGSSEELDSFARTILAAFREETRVEERPFPGWSSSTCIQDMVGLTEIYSRNEALREKDRREEEVITSLSK